MHSIQLKPDSIQSWAFCLEKQSVLLHSHSCQADQLSLIRVLADLTMLQEQAVGSDQLHSGHCQETNADLSM